MKARFALIGLTLSGTLVFIAIFCPVAMAPPPNMCTSTQTYVDLSRSQVTPGDTVAFNYEHNRGYCVFDEIRCEEYEGEVFATYRFEYVLEVWWDPGTAGEVLLGKYTGGGENSMAAPVNVSSTFIVPADAANGIHTIAFRSETTLYVTCSQVLSTENLTSDDSYEVTVFDGVQDDAYAIAPASISVLPATGPTPHLALAGIAAGGLGLLLRAYSRRVRL
ncbi:MAG: hypothetical protein ACYC6O_03990 [Thermoleophilia bacterium]